MNLENTIESVAKVENAGGQYYLIFPFTSAVGKDTEDLSVQLPIKLEQPSPNDKKALLEAVTVQGGMGKWVQKDDGTIWLIPSE